MSDRCSGRGQRSRGGDRSSSGRSRGRSSSRHGSRYYYFCDKTTVRMTIIKTNSKRRELCIDSARENNHIGYAQ